MSKTKSQLKRFEHVIIGNSAAAVGAIEALRGAGDTGTIAVFSDEPYHVYSRPLISYLLAGKVTEKRMYYRPLSFYDHNEVEAHLDEPAEGLDFENRKLETAAGSYEFGHLLLATGGVPFVPPLPGSDLEGVFTFTKWADVDSIEAYLEKYQARRAIVIGGGLIGLKSTEALLRRGLEVTIIELAPRIMSNAFDTTASDLARDILEANGCRVLTENTAEALLEKDGRVSGARLKSGEELSADLVVVAIGVRPNLALVRDTAIEVNRGLMVDNRMATNVDGVYGAGDVAEGPDLLLKVKRPIPIWPNAYKQGKTAGRNMAGVEYELPGVFVMNSIDVLDVSTISAGITDPGDDPEAEVLMRVDKPARRYRKVVLKQNRLIGMVTFGDVDRAGLFTGLIRSGVDISKAKDRLLAEDFGLHDIPTEHLSEKIFAPGIVP